MLLMIPLRFEAMTKKTIASLSVIAFLGEEAPVDGDFTCIAEDGPEHAPE